MSHKPTLHIDKETFSTIDLTKVGAHAYSEHPDTGITCLYGAVDDGPVEQLWIPQNGQAMPHVLHFAVTGEWDIVAHNAAFERAMWHGVFADRFGWPKPKLSQWKCTMAMALALSLPASLKNATRAVGIDDGGKADEGHALMLQMCKPRRPRKGEDPDGVYWFHDPERLQRLYAVCAKDVADERELHRRILGLRPSEQQLWQLDAKINDRGVYVDVNLCDQALKIVGQATTWLNEELRELTGGAVPAATNVAQIVEWLRDQGVVTASLDKEHIEDLLSRPDLTPVVRRVLDIRREAAKASVKKIQALLNGKSANGRAKGLLQFHAAGTGRWAGRRFQPQNIKRPELEDVEGAIDAVLTGDAAYVRVLYGEPLSVVGDCLRGMVRAAPGNVLYAADFSNIEGRLQAWLAGEEWKLEAFRKFDAGTGPDVYKLAVSDLFSIPVETVTKQQRQDIGKVQELASGYQGGIASYLKFGIADAFPILVPKIRASADGYEWEEAWDKFSPSNSNGLAQTEWTAVRITVDRWRAKHSNIEQCWYDLENSAKAAIVNRGTVVPCGRIAFRVAGSFLFMRLPSGRCIAYPYPCIKEKRTPWGAMKPTMSYKGMDQYTHKWTDCYAHGGLLFNNAVQGAARDIEADAMVRVERAGYYNILSVHDEVVCETKADFGTLEEYEALMVASSPTYEGLPVAASGFRAERYRK